jgi:3'(2'), 5'-bisphosphate nucleotidase
MTDLSASYSRKELLNQAIKAALEAGKAILEVYRSGNFEVEVKSDNSPLTLADRKAHEIISTFLEATGFPVLSEESNAISYEERRKWKKFWLVDPLDGTKDFIKRNGEFTVNIAFIIDQAPVLGVVYTPVDDQLYYADLNLGSFRISNASNLEWNGGINIDKGVKLPCSGNNDFRIVASRSHLNPETAAFIDGLKRKHPDARIVSRGSSLKLCMIAEGEADVYPRFAPTSEWDTAAGHAIVLASGGRISLAGNDDNTLVYNKKEMLNPWFIAFRKTNPPTNQS